MERMNHLPLVGCGLDRTHSQAVSKECLKKLANLFKWINNTQSLPHTCSLPCALFWETASWIKRAWGQTSCCHKRSHQLWDWTPGFWDRRSEGPKPRERHRGLAHPCMGKCCCDNGSLWLCHRSGKPSHVLSSPSLLLELTLTYHNPSGRQLFLL